jgi:NAD(P)H-nitrite reductase large subunit
MQTIKYKKEDFYTKNNITVKLNTKAENINTTKKEVSCSNGEVYKYDKLLIATGSIPFVPKIEGIEKHKNVYTFLNLESVINIKKAITKNSDVVIIGAGLIGLKAAEALAEQVKSVHVCDMADRVMGSVLDKNSASIIQNHIEKHNVKFYLSNTAKEVKENSVILADGTELKCDVLIMAVGVRPNVALAQSANIKINRGIVVDKNMQTSVKDIYAAGDCVESLEVLSNQNKILALWPNAFVQGKTAGANMAGTKQEFNGGFPLNAIGFFGLHLISAGIIEPKEEGFKVCIDYDKEKQTLKKLVIKDDKLEGFALINANERAGIYTSLINDKIPLSSLNYDITKQNIGLSAFSKEIRENKIFGGI